MNTSFYISTTKVEGSTQISAEDLEKIIRCFSKREQHNSKSSHQSKQTGKSKKLNDYIDSFIRETEDGKRITGKGTRFSKGTIGSIKQSLKKFKEFQLARGLELGFEEVDMGVYRDFNSYLIDVSSKVNFPQIVL